MTLRPAKQEDLAELFEMHREVFGTHIEKIWGWDEDWQRGNFAAEINSSTTSVVDIDGRIAGYIQIREEADRLYLQNLALAPVFQGKGLGRRLVESLQNSAADRDMYVALVVFRTNTRAHRFYEQCGFRTVGMSDQYFEMEWSPLNTISSAAEQY